MRARPLLRLLGSGVNLPLILGAAALAAYAWGAGPYDLRLLAITGCSVLMVTGFQFAFGYAGAISLAQSCFFGLGAYVTGVLGATYGFTTLATLPLSILAAAALAAIVAIPVLKLDEQYFALATLVVSLLVQLIATQWSAVTGGTNGLPGIPDINLAGWSPDGRFETMLTVWGFVGLGLLLAWQIRRGLFGRSYHLVRENLSVAAALGLDVARMRFTAFVLSAAYGGAGGALLAHVVHVVSPEQIGLPTMVTCLTMTVIGGRLSLPGAVLGALLVTYLREWFLFIQDYTLMAYGAVTLVFLILAPYGLIGTLQALRTRLLPAMPQAPPAGRPLGFNTAPGAGPLLSASGLSLSFGGVKAVDGVSLNLLPGEIVGLIGPNGSGKTTLLNLLSGLYESDSGTLVFRNQDVTRALAFRIARLGMARTLQHIHLVDEMSVLDNIALGAASNEHAGLWRALLARRNNGRKDGRDDGLKAAQACAVTAAQTLGIAAQLASPCGGLPYGTRRRVEVARALAAEPCLLLLDEPAAGLNEEEQRDFARRIRGIADRGVTVLVVEHNMVFLQALAERLVCLDQGRIIAAGAPDMVRSDAKVIEAYLGTAA